MIGSFHGLNHWLARRPSNKKHPLFVRTANFSPTLKQSGATFSNLGASGTITATLPTNGKGEKGITYTFFLATNQQVDLDPGAGNAFYRVSAKTTDAKKLELTSIGTCVTIVSDGNGDWIVTHAVGSTAAES